MRTFLQRLIAAALFLVIHAAGAQAQVEFAPGQVLIKPAAGLSEARLARILENSGGRALRRLEGLDVRIVEVPEGAEARIARALAQNPRIAFAELNRRVPPIATVNDPDFSKQWHLTTMGAPGAWDYTFGDGVTVAVLDTGVYPYHSDLSGKVLSGWNTVSQNSDTADIQGHGTWVAGVVGAIADNLNGGASTAPGAMILPIRITNDSAGWAYFSDMAEGITWAADNGAKVANLSYGGAAGSSTVASAASYMMDKGGVVVVAAGNDNTDYGYANSPYLYVAAATTSSDARASYSSFGQFVDIAAPGSSIYTTASGGGYQSVNGTSFASPNAAAVAAMVMAANPALTPTDVLAVVSGTALDLGNAGWDPYYGHGRVDAHGAVALAAGAVTSDTTAPSVGLDSPKEGAEVSDVASVSVSASDGFGVKEVRLYVNGVLTATEISGEAGSYLFAWDTSQVGDGQVRLTATASDHAGNEGTTGDVYVSVANAAADTVPPSVSVTAPSDGATVSGHVTVSAAASDDQKMESVSVYVNGRLRCSGTSSTSCNWNTRKEPDGQHSVSAIAIDAAGNRAEASITVTKGGSTVDGGGGKEKTNPGKGNKK